MTRDDIIRMAREAGIPVAIVAGNPSVAQIERFAQLVSEHEREACAKVADEAAQQVLEHNFSALIAYTICARSQQ